MTGPVRSFAEDPAVAPSQRGWAQTWCCRCCCWDPHPTLGKPTDFSAWLLARSARLVGVQVVGGVLFGGSVLLLSGEVVGVQLEVFKKGLRMEKPASSMNR